MISGFNIKKKLVSISLKAKLMALPNPIFLFCVIIFSIFEKSLIFLLSDHFYHYQLPIIFKIDELF